jgi:hypothetical protein
LGKKGLLALAPLPDARETEIRNATLDVLYEVYEQMEHDTNKFFRVGPAMFVRQLYSRYLEGARNRV